LKPSFAQSFEVLAEVNARVDLYAYLTVGVEMKVLFGECEQILDLFGCQVRWRAAAPMELDHGAILSETLRLMRFISSFSTSR